MWNSLKLSGVKALILQGALYATKSEKSKEEGEKGPENSKHCLCILIMCPRTADQVLCKTALPGKKKKKGLTVSWAKC